MNAPQPTFSPIQDRLLGFLAAGVPQVQAATACGVDPSYISQLLSEPQFKEELLRRSAASLEADLRHDTSIETVEAKALEAIQQKLPFVRSSLEAARIFAILNSAKKRATATEAAPRESAGTITLTLPAALARSVDIRLNSSNQVIEVEGRPMAPLPSSQLPKLAEQDAARAATLLAAPSTPLPATPSLIESLNL